MPSDNASGAVDMHFHLLPGVDDGPSDLADSLELARAAVAAGTATVVATPHVRGDFVTDVLTLPERVRAMQAALDRERLPLRVLCGAELGHDMVGRLSQDALELIAQGPPGRRWVLLETPFGMLGSAFHTAAEELRDRGFGVVLAHPERSADADLEDLPGIRRQLARGALAQVNALSLTGGHGVEAERAGVRLVSAGLVAVIGSDAHGPSRPPALGPARAALLRHGLGGRARALTQGGPRRLVAQGVQAPLVAA